MQVIGNNPMTSAPLQAGYETNESTNHEDMASSSGEENEKEFTAKQKNKNLDVKPNFSVLMETFNKVYQLAVRHGCETVTYGAAIQMKKAIETNGSLCAGNLEDII